MRLPACVLLAATMLASPVQSQTTPQAAPQTAPEPIHGYDGLALAPKGDRLAAVEPAGKDHSAIVLRAATDGHVLTTLDPCGTCTYAGLSFAQDGALAFVARDRAKEPPA
jgi:hypothetical protein